MIHLLRQLIQFVTASIMMTQFHQSLKEHV